MEQTTAGAEVTETSAIDTALTSANITHQVLAALKEQYLPLKINSIDDVHTIDAVEKAKKECSRLRNLTTTICKKGREKAIQEQKDWISKEKEVVAQISEVEDYLKAELKRIEDEKDRVLFHAAQMGKLPIRKARLDTIGMSVADEELLKLNDEQFIALFNDLHSQKLAEQAAHIKAEQDRIDAIKRDQEKKEAARVAEENRRREIKAAEARAWAEAEEKAKIDAERKAAEAAEAIRKAEEAKAKAERDAAESLQREKAAREQAERDKLLAQRESSLIASGFNFDGNTYGVGDWKRLDRGTITSLSQSEFVEVVTSGASEAARLETLALWEMEQKAKAQAEEKARIDAETKRIADEQALLAMGDAEKWTGFVRELNDLREKYKDFKSAKSKRRWIFVTGHIDTIIGYSNDKI